MSNSERVEIDVDPAEFVDDAGLAEQGGDAGLAEQGGGALQGGGESRAPRSASNFFEMLQATEPAESPEMQDGTLSTGAQWHQHAELAFKKITGSSGTPAWLNLAMAAILAVVQQQGGGESSSSEPTDATGAEDVQVT